MNRIVIFIFQIALLTFTNSISAQNPLVKQWDKRYGSSNTDNVHVILNTPKGGYILAGTSFSNAGDDKNEDNRDITMQTPDYWIIELDSIGNKLWDKTYGGDKLESMRSMIPTADGGYILAGNSESGISGDKTTIAQGDRDYWIVKIDSVGNKQWDRGYGGAGTENVHRARQTLDGGYIVSGWTDSPVSGDVSQPGINWQDYWVVRTDSLGNKLWDKRFTTGASDNGKDIFLTPDNGFIFSGESASGAYNDKTCPLWNNTGTDIWLIKIDSLGNKEWDKCLGGYMFDIMRNGIPDGLDFVLSTNSTSDSSGDKSENSRGGFDYWIIKIDSSGNKIWDRTFGGPGDDDRHGNIIKTSDGGLIITGASWSNAGGDKSENNLGQIQSWIVKMDSLQNKQWDKTILTNGIDFHSFGIEISPRCYVFAVITNSEIAGEVSVPNYDPTNTTTDYWVIKYCDTTTAGTVALPENINLNLKVNPNPFNEYIIVSLENLKINALHVNIRNSVGIIYKNQILSKPDNSQYRIDTRELPSGFYVLELLFDNRQVMKKIIKQTF